jgi:hypothetical protein
MAASEAQGKFMKNKGELAPPKPGRAWTKPEDYLSALARRRTARKAREPKPRTQPEAPRFLLSTLPFLVLLGALAVMAVAIMIAAFPGARPQPKAELQLAQHELGTAPKGWFQEAQKQFH